ncbi:HEAT repeat domain-containing protein [Candidatus Ozemobacteraceae bacterium]|nr:HEAT repeat domain-containing protein [Candidatus Ozemobacteraceae bacterium]
MQISEINQLLAANNTKLADYALKQWLELYPNDPEPLMLALRSADTGTVRKALKLAVAHHPKACIATIVELLKNPDHIIRREVVMRLDPAMGPTAAAAIRSIFTSDNPDTHPHVIATAVVAVGRFRLEAELITPFLKHKDDRVRANTVRGLAMLAPPDLRKHLEPRLHDASTRVQNEAIKALAPLITEADIENLILRRIASPDVKIRAATADLIGNLPLSRKVAHLCTMLSDTEARVISVAARVLAQLGDSTGIRTITNKYFTTPDEEVANGLSEIMASIPTEKIIPLAERYLPVQAAPELIVRRTLNIACQSAGWEGFLPWIIGAVQRHEPDLRISALTIMLKHADFFTAQLDELIKNVDRITQPKERAMAALLRWRAGRFDGFETLKIMLYDQASIESRQAAAKLLQGESGILPRQILAEAARAGIREALVDPQEGKALITTSIKLPI